MDDLISRQAAIDVVDAVWSVTGDTNVAKVWDQIKDLPSAQPEITETQVKEYCEKRCLVVLTLDLFQRLKSTQPARKKGRWLNKGRKICCSECGRVNFCKPNFCNECGADMREEKTDERTYMA